MPKPTVKDEIKRSKQAPTFVGTLKTTKGQLAVEKFLQVRNFDLQKYIQEGRVLDFHIPMKELQELWGDKKNMKRDVANFCDLLMQEKIDKVSPNGNFLKMRLVSIAQLTNEGLHLQFVPAALELYRISNNTEDFATIDCFQVSFFKCSFTPQLYWLLRQYRGKRKSISFTLTPDDVRKQWGVTYLPALLQTKVLIPAKEELEELFENGVVDVKCQIIVNRNGRGQGGGKIQSWTFNVITTQLEEMIAGERYEWLKDIDNFFAKELPMKRMYIYQQISAEDFPHEKLFKLHQRIVKLQNGELATAKDSAKYICAILLAPEFRINPNASTPLTEPKTSTQEKLSSQQSEYQSSPTLPGLFDDTCQEVSVTLWLECVRQLKETFEKPIGEEDAPYGQSKSLSVYDLYMASFYPLSFKDNVLIIQAASAFQIDIIKEKYGDKLVDIMRQVFGKTINVKLIPKV